MSMSRNSVLFSAMTIVIGGALAGCGEETTTIQLSYERPAQVQIPAKVKKIAIAEFSGRTAADKRWGGITADKLSGELEKVNRSFHRYELVDRQNLGTLLKEQDLQIMNSDQAIKFGKLANVQAMIFGNVTVSARDEQRTKQKPVPDFKQGLRFETVRYPYRFVMVSVHLTMTDVDTGKVLCSLPFQKEFDSDKDQSFFGGMFGSGNPPSIDESVSKAVEAAVQEFPRQISPHRESISVKLENGKSDKVLSGNKLAKSGDYALALDAYKMAIADRPDDDGALFNAGVMYEATGDFANADHSYLKAFQVGNKDKYLEARRRVHVETKVEPKASNQ